jgi:DNA-binding transcriptional LysR family regulator
VFELRRLRLLHELALRGTLAAVAEALSYSPSTVSQQLAQLEKDAGVPLLEPDGRRVRLTEYGAALAAHAARALELEEHVRGELDALQPGSGRVRVAAFQTAAHGILPAALGLLAERSPRLRVEVAELPPEEGLFELVARGVDLVIAEQYPGHTREHRGGLARETIGSDPIRLATPRGDDANALAQLSARAWVMEPEGTAARQWAVQQCRAAGFEPDVRFEIADLTAHARLIATGHAVGMLPDLLWTDQRADVRLVDLPGRPTREIFTATRASAAAQPAVAATRDALRDAYRSRGSQASFTRPE